MSTKTVNRAWLKRQIEAGNVEARCKYHYTDDYAWDNANNFGKSDWAPARINPEQVWQPVNPDDPNSRVHCTNNHERNIPGYASFDADDFRGYGSAWWNDDNTITFQIHSNLSFAMRLIKPVESNGTRKETAAPSQNIFDKLEALATRITQDQEKYLRRSNLACSANLKNAIATVKYGKKYARVDIGTSGAYMVEIATGRIYGIKGYGVPHKGHYFGTLDQIADYDWGGYRATRKPEQPAKPQPVNRFAGFYEDAC